VGLKKASTRDQFFQALHGGSTVYTKDMSVDLSAAIIYPDHARIEVEAALGIKVALLQINPEWTILFVPRKKQAFRFPTSELYKNTKRRERFLALLPVPVYPEIFFEAVLTLAQLRGPQGKSLKCSYDKKMNAYLFRVPELKGVGGRWVAIDPTRYLPVEIAYFDRALPTKWGGEDFRPRLRAKFSKLTGQALATIPRQIELFKNGVSEFRYVWRSAESWTGADKNAMNWRPTASIKVIDY